MVLVLMIILVYMTMQYNINKNKFEYFANGSTYTFVAYQDIVDPLIRIGPAPQSITGKSSITSQFDINHTIDGYQPSTHIIENPVSGMFQYGIDKEYDNSAPENQSNPTIANLGAFRIITPSNPTGDIFHINGQDTNDIAGRYYGYFINQFNIRKPFNLSPYPGQQSTVLQNGRLEIGYFTSNPPLNIPPPPSRPPPSQVKLQGDNTNMPSIKPPYSWSSCTSSPIKPLISTAIGPIDNLYNQGSGFHDKRTNVIFDANGLNYLLSPNGAGPNGKYGLIQPNDTVGNVCNGNFTHIRIILSSNIQLNNTTNPLYFNIIKKDIYDIYGYFVDKFGNKLDQNPLPDPNSVPIIRSTDIMSFEPGFWISTLDNNVKYTNFNFPPNTYDVNLNNNPGNGSSQRTFCRWLRPTDPDNINSAEYCQVQYDNSSEVILTEGCMNVPLSSVGVGNYTPLENVKKTETYYYLKPNPDNPNGNDLYIQPGQTCPDPSFIFGNLNTESSTQSTPSPDSTQSPLSSLLTPSTQTSGRLGGLL